MNLGARILKFILRPFPRSFLRAIGKPFGFLWFDLIRFRRKIVINNISASFPEWSDEKKIKIARRSVYNLMENFFEFFLIPAIDDQWLKENVVFEGLENINAALADNKGALVLSLHLGDGDLMANCYARLGYDVSIITKFFKNSFLNTLWFGIRGAQGVKYIPPHGEKTPFMILKALKRNGLVGFVLDQHMGKPYGVRTRFFGRPAGSAYGLALFHLKTERPVIPMYTFIANDGKIHVVTEPAFVYTQDLKIKDRDQTLVELTQRYTDKIEEIVRRYPEQWMWIHRRWKWKDAGIGKD